MEDGALAADANAANKDDMSALVRAAAGAHIDDAVRCWLAGWLAGWLRVRWGQRVPSRGSLHC